LPEKEYEILLGENARKRHYHSTERGKIIDFMVQLEVNVKGEWKPVIRYDRAHGYAHCDRYNLKGKKEKEEIYLPYEEVLTLADEDIDDNWEIYKLRFLRGGYP
jgi:hypothetical protein